MIGSNILHYQRVESTNTTAEELLTRGNLAEGTVVVALEQTKGRGQNQNVWRSEAGKNLTFTVILYPRFLPADQQFLLNKSISLAILDLLKEPSTFHEGWPPLKGRVNPDEFRIKWPNDIYYRNKKLGGILITHRIMGPGIDTSIVGIGLNVNQTIFPDDLPNPVSLKQIWGEESPLPSLLEALCNALNRRYAMLKSGDWDKQMRLDHDYEKSLLGFGILRDFTNSDRSFQGTIRGVDELGRLMVETTNGEIGLFNHKEIELKIL